MRNLLPLALPFLMCFCQPDPVITPGTCIMVVPDASCPDLVICNSFCAATGVVSELTDGGSAVLIRTTGLPQHEAGPYGKNPNTAAAQNYTFYVPLNQSLDPMSVSTKTATSLGPAAVAYNGVPLFNPSDGRNIGGCTGNAGFLESDHVDVYGGHPTRESQYHYHSGFFLQTIDVLGIGNAADGHSPILGWSWDGYPIYGPMGYSDPADSASGVRLLKSCHSLLSSRTCCTDPNVCGTSAVYDNKTLVMGAFVEDYQHDSAALAGGSCDLDRYNMRYQVTPEFPGGVWAYIMTVDETNPVVIMFPYFIGMQYAGEVDTRNFP